MKGEMILSIKIKRTLKEYLWSMIKKL